MWTSVDVNRLGGVMGHYELNWSSPPSGQLANYTLSV